MPGQKRTIRSFVRRTGRMTASQQRALKQLWPACGVDYSPSPIDLDQLFGRSARRVLEIGFGNGETLVQQAIDAPEEDFIGIEVHEPGVGHCLLHAAHAEITNLRIISHDAIEVLNQQIADGALARINLYFPDPWPKKRHHKRRIIQPAFLALAARKLEPDGEMFIATDWGPYAEHIDEVIAGRDVFRVSERREHGGDRPLDRPTTKFERRGLKLGHSIVDWQLRKV